MEILSCDLLAGAALGPNEKNAQADGVFLALAGTP
jgi:hypothetical protein